MQPYSELLALLGSHNSFLITTHVNPDGDAIGSEMAMYHFLTSAGKSVRVVNISKTPYYLEFLDEGKVIEHFNEAVHAAAFADAEVLIALDFNRVGRLARMGQLFAQSAAKKICIDHHQDPETLFDLIITSTQHCATGHILYDIFEAAGYAYGYATALQLYAAIMTDTGSFRFERTTPAVHRIAARLLELGVVPQEVHLKIYDTSREGKIRLLGEALSSVTLFGSQRQLGVMSLSRETLLNSGTDESDTDGFINIMMSIDSVLVGLKFLELEEGFKVSLRSKGDIPVHKLAALWGGGGHKNAAGIRIRNRGLAAMQEEIIARALTFINELKA